METIVRELIALMHILLDRNDLMSVLKNCKKKQMNFPIDIRKYNLRITSRYFLSNLIK